MVRFCRFLTGWGVLALLTPVPLSAGSISGKVPLPDAPPAPVMAERYRIVSQGDALATIPPVAVVFLEGEFDTPPSPPDREVVQENFTFAPALLAIPTGTRVYFPNHDSEYHNVFSYSPAKRFDLGRYPPGAEPPPSQVFDTPGQVVLRCDIHEHMRAIILVLDTPHFVLTRPDGTFDLEGIPPGTYTLKAWLNTATTLSQTLTLGADEALVIGEW